MIGLGEVFNEEGLALLPPGSVAVVPGGTNHFQYSESEEYVVQVQGHGPAATNYVNRNDDPRA